jgi:flagellar hook-associated protein 1 FlgK
VTRLSTARSSVASGGDGRRLPLDVVSPLPVAGDRFLLQPVGGAALNMQRVLDDPRASRPPRRSPPASATTNTGTATVGQPESGEHRAEPAARRQHQLTSDTGNYDWQLTDSGGTVVSSGSATWQAGQPIALNGWRMELNGVPKNGDTATVQRTAFPASNNGNALALTDLRDVRMVGQSPSSSGVTITDALRQRDDRGPACACKSPRWRPTCRPRSPTMHRPR